LGGALSIVYNVAAYAHDAKG